MYYFFSRYYTLSSKNNLDELPTNTFYIPTIVTHIKKYLVDNRKIQT